jgi:cation diffusion facilitator CzcD-associated flavoprotein CzcO
MLALSLILVFVSSLSSLLVTRDIISPWLWEVEASATSLDASLTPRLIFFWGTVLAAGWFVFAGIGMNSVRDLHKVIKECHDLVLRNRKVELRRAAPEKSA